MTSEEGKGRRREVRFAAFRFDPETLELWRDEEPVLLAPKPAHILAALLARSGRLVSRQELYAVGWAAGTISVDLALNATVRQLRRALGERASGDGLIQTLPGRGYRFAGEVRTVEPPPTEDRGGASASGRPGRTRLAGRRWPKPSRLAGLSIACGLGWWFALGTSAPATVMVTPIRVLDDARSAVNSTALEEAIRSEMARSGRRGFAVLARGPGVSSIKSRTFTVESTLFAAPGGEPRLDVRVVRRDTGTIVWSGWFDPFCPYFPNTAAHVASYVTRVLGRGT